MLFCEALETTTIAINIYIYIRKLKTYLYDKQIPMENMISCAADDMPVMMGKKEENGVFKLLKNDNP